MYVDYRYIYTVLGLTGDRLDLGQLDCSTGISSFMIYYVTQSATTDTLHLNIAPSHYNGTVCICSITMKNVWETRMVKLRI